MRTESRGFQEETAGLHLKGGDSIFCFYVNGRKLILIGGDYLKKLYLIFLTIILIIGISSSASALLYTFEGSDAGGTGSATMDVSVSGNTLTAIIDNTSPTDLDGAIVGTGGNSPGITGFGINLDPDTLSLVSWTLTAYDTTSSLITIGSDTGSWDWMMDTSHEGVIMDYLPHTVGGIDGALYNPLALLDSNNTLPGGVNDTYFTTATLEIIFDGAPILLSDFENYYVRMQNVGLDGEGSLKLNPVPEPATMLLLGSGLLGLAGYGRRKKLFKK